VTIPIRTDFNKNKAARKGRVDGLMEKDYEFIQAVAFSGWFSAAERERSGDFANWHEFHDPGGAGSDHFSHWNFYMAEWMDGRTLNFLGQYHVLTADTLTIRLYDDETDTPGPEVTVTETLLTDKILTLPLAAPFRETHEIRLQGKLSASPDQGFWANLDPQKQYCWITDP